MKALFITLLLLNLVFSNDMFDFELPDFFKQYLVANDKRGIGKPVLHKPLKNNDLKGILDKYLNFYRLQLI